MEMMNRWGHGLGIALLVLAVGCGDDDSDGKKQPDDKGNHQGDVGNGDGDGDTGDDHQTGDGDTGDDHQTGDGDTGDDHQTGDGDTGNDHQTGDDGSDEDDGQNDDGNGSSGKLGKDLSEAEAEALCEELSAGIEEDWSKEQNCTIGAVFYTQDKATCEALAKKCADAPDEDEDDDDDDADEEDDDSCKDAADDLKTCTATVDEIRTCIQATTNNFQSLGTVTCESAGKLSESDFDTPPPECASVQEKCPDLFSDEGEDVSLPTEDSSEGASMMRLVRPLTR
jgi:hypothetical protein